MTRSRLREVRDRAGNAQDAMAPSRAERAARVGPREDPLGRRVEPHVARNEAPVELAVAARGLALQARR